MPGNLAVTNEKPNPASNGDLGSSNRIRLKRSIGLLEGTAITIGAIVGSGIFISPKGVVESAGSVGLSLVVWVASGFVTLMGAFCYAELGTSLPSSGGDYHYLHEAFGPVPAFLFIWAAVMIFIPCANAIQALSFAQYVIQPFFATDCQLPDTAIRLLAAAAICFLIALNCWDVKSATRVQNVFMFAKLFVLVLIIGSGALNLFQGQMENFSDPFKGSNQGPANIALAFYSGIFAYSGANVLGCMTEEIKDPTKTLPRAILISMITVIVAYLMANVAYFTVLSPYDILHSDAVAVTFGDKTLSFATWIIPICVAISTFGGLGVGILPCSRILFSGARKGQFPQVLAFIQVQRLTPMPSLIFMGALSLLYLSTSDIYALINYAGFMYSLAAVGVAASILYLRRKRPDLPRPIKVPLLFPILYLITSLFLFVLPMYAAPWEASMGGLIVLSGLPVYFLLVENNKEAVQKPWLDSATRTIQKLLISVPGE